MEMMGEKGTDCGGEMKIKKERIGNDGERRKQNVEEKGKQKEGEKWK
jgi:hypothetical protein